MLKRTGQPRHSYVYDVPCKRPICQFAESTRHRATNPHTNLSKIALYFYFYFTLYYTGLVVVRAVGYLITETYNVPESTVQQHQKHHTQLFFKDYTQNEQNYDTHDDTDVLLFRVTDCDARIHTLLSSRVTAGDGGRCSTREELPSASTNS